SAFSSDIGPAPGRGQRGGAPLVECVTLAAARPPPRATRTPPMTTAGVSYFPVERLREFSARVFEHFGVPPADAERAADVLASADLRGIDSHGVARLHAYFDMLSHGRINPRPNVRVVRELPATATIDGDNGLGLVVGPAANEVAMAKAEAVGAAAVSVS